MPDIKITITLLLLSLVFPGFSQNSRDILYKENLAGEHLQNQSFKNALNLYLELDSISPGSDKYNYPIGLSYINLANETQALKYFEKCLSTPETHPITLHYYSAKAYHLSHQLEKAIFQYNQFKEKFLARNKRKRHKKQREKVLKEIDREIAMCEYGKTLIKNAPEIEIQNLGPEINSPYPDYGVVITADENQIFFTSTRPGTTGGQIDNSDGLGLHFEDIYKSSRTATGWSNPEKLEAPVNTSGNDASVSLSADGQKLLIYRSVKENFLSATSGDIFISTLKGNKWTEPEKLPDVINSKSWEPSASLSADERVLYFSSNREGGYGGTDIYIVKRLPNGEWAKPMNMGPIVNTPYDDDCPFIHPDGKTLYFSSKGHKTMGGFDVFVTVYNEEDHKWSTPENVGYPFSTAHDDIHLAWSADGKKVYFSSKKPGGYGDKDIYFAEMEKEEANLVVLKGTVTDSIRNVPMEAVITVKDQVSNELIGIFNSNSETGKYLVVLPEGKQYIFSISAEDYYDCSEEITVPKTGGFDVINKDIRLCGKQLNPLH